MIDVIARPSSLELIQGHSSSDWSIENEEGERGEEENCYRKDDEVVSKVEIVKIVKRITISSDCHAIITSFIQNLKTFFLFSTR